MAIENVDKEYVDPKPALCPCGSMVSSFTDIDAGIRLYRHGEYILDCEKLLASVGYESYMEAWTEWNIEVHRKMGLIPRTNS